MACQSNRLVKLRPAKGFSLIEIAVVLVIVGLIAGVAIQGYVTRLVQQRIDTSRTKADTIKTALTNFLSRNNRLPCPAVATAAPGAAGYGVEAANPGTCTGMTPIGTAPNQSVRGIVPWVMLGLPSEAVSDAYNNRYSYQVTLADTNLTAANMPFMIGFLTVNSGNVPPLPPVANIVATILSHGANGLGAYTENGIQLALPPPANAAESQNATGANNIFIQRDYDEQMYDDILVMLSPDDLLAPLIKQGAVGSPRAVTRQQMENRRDELIVSITNSGNVPATMTAINDGWGRPLQYSQLIAAPYGVIVLSMQFVTV